MNGATLSHMHSGQSFRFPRLFLLRLSLQWANVVSFAIRVTCASHSFSWLFVPHGVCVFVIMVDYVIHLSPVFASYFCPLRCAMRFSKSCWHFAGISQTHKCKEHKYIYIYKYKKIRNGMMRGWGLDLRVEHGNEE